MGAVPPVGACHFHSTHNTIPSALPRRDGVRQRPCSAYLHCLRSTQPAVWAAQWAPYREPCLPEEAAPFWKEKSEGSGDRVRVSPGQRGEMRLTSSGAWGAGKKRRRGRRERRRVSLGQGKASKGLSQCLLRGALRAGAAAVGCLVWMDTRTEARTGAAPATGASAVWAEGVICFSSFLIEKPILVVGFVV